MSFPRPTNRQRLYVFINTLCKLRGGSYPADSRLADKRTNQDRFLQNLICGFGKLPGLATKEVSDGVRQAIWYELRIKLSLLSYNEDKKSLCDDNYYGRG